MSGEHDISEPMMREWSPPGSSTAFEFMGSHVSTPGAETAPPFLEISQPPYVAYNCARCSAFTVMSLWTEANSIHVCMCIVSLAVTAGKNPIPQSVDLLWLYLQTPSAHAIFSVFYGAYIYALARIEIVHERCFTKQNFAIRMKIMFSYVETFEIYVNNPDVICIDSTYVRQRSIEAIDAQIILNDIDLDSTVS